jgi:Tfp pilus assembly protein PilV
MFFSFTKKNTGGKKFLGGFTLLEALMTIFIFTTIIGGVVALFKTVFVTSIQQTRSLSTIDQARKVAFNFTNEMRNGTTGNDGGYPINKADDNQIIFFSHYNTVGTAVNRIRYYTASNTLYRGVITPSANRKACCRKKHQQHCVRSRWIHLHRKNQSGRRRCSCWRTYILIIYEH